MFISRFRAGLEWLEVVYPNGAWVASKLRVLGFDELGGRCGYESAIQVGLGVLVVRR